MEQFSYNRARYRSLRKAGLCVSCKRPVDSGKSRCPVCMKALEESVKKSKRKRIARMESRIRELEAMVL